MKYRTRTVEVEAIQYTGANAQEVAHFVGQLTLPHYSNGDQLMIPVGRGTGIAILSPGSWVVREPDGWFNIMNDKVFYARYEAPQP